MMMITVMMIVDNDVNDYHFVHVFLLFTSASLQKSIPHERPDNQGLDCAII